MKLEITIPDSILANTLDSAASRYWCSELVFADFDSTGLAYSTCWHALLAGRLAKVVVIDGITEKRHTVDYLSITKGLRLLSEKSPMIFGRLLADQCDSGYADAVLQYVSLGSALYG